MEPDSWTTYARFCFCCLFLVGSLLSLGGMCMFVPRPWKNECYFHVPMNDKFALLFCFLFWKLPILSLWCPINVNFVVLSEVLDKVFSPANTHPHAHTTSIHSNELLLLVLVDGWVKMRKCCLHAFKLKIVWLKMIMRSKLLVHFPPLISYKYSIFECTEYSLQTTLELLMK